MKKLILSFVCVILLGNVFSQIIIVPIKHVQVFEHPFMKTNQAILENKITYKTNGPTTSYYKFDFDKMILYRDMEGLLEEFEIVEKKNDLNAILNVFVKFADNDLVNYIFEKTDNNSKLFLCRWQEGDIIKGWFDSTIK